MTHRASRQLTSRPSRGFTIVELLIVIVVIAILAAITIVAYNGVQASANDSAVRSDVANFAKKIELFNVNNGRYPRSTSELDSLGVSVASGSYANHANALMYCIDSTGRWSIGGVSTRAGFYFSSETGRVVERAYWNAGNPCSDFGVAHNMSGDWAAYRRATVTWSAGGTHLIP